MTETGKHAMVEADKVVGSFGIARLPLEVSLDNSTPSHVYDGGMGALGLRFLPRGRPLVCIVSSFVLS